jgi:hypothetical protein
MTKTSYFYIMMKKVTFISRTFCHDIKVTCFRHDIKVTCFRHDIKVICLHHDIKVTCFPQWYKRNFIGENKLLLYHWGTQVTFISLGKTSYFYIIGENKLLLYHGEDKLLLYHGENKLLLYHNDINVTCFPQWYKSNLFSPMI